MVPKERAAIPGTPAQRREVKDNKVHRKKEGKGKGQRETETPDKKDTGEESKEREKGKPVDSKGADSFP